MLYVIIVPVSWDVQAVKKPDASYALVACVMLNDICRTGSRPAHAVTGRARPCARVASTELRKFRCRQVILHEHSPLDVQRQLSGPNVFYLR